MDYRVGKEEQKIIKTPVMIGDTVYVICDCEHIPTQLDGTLYGPDGGFGTATGYYCPYEDCCPFDDIEGCQDANGKEAVFEDTVTSLFITEHNIAIGLENCSDGMFYIGVSAFTTREQAEEILRNRGGE